MTPMTSLVLWFHYLLPYVLHPTRVIAHSSTVIDNILSNITDFDTKNGNIICDISDHFPQILIFDRTRPDYKSFSIAKHDFWHENEFVNDYSALDLRFLNDDNVSVDDKFASFDDSRVSTCSLVDKHIHSKKMTHKEIKLQSKPWINFKIATLIKYHDRLKRRMI